MQKEKAGGPVPWSLDEFARRGRAAQAAADAVLKPPHMNDTARPMLPNAWHPGARCSCRDCLAAHPTNCDWWPLP